MDVKFYDKDLPRQPHRLANGMQNNSYLLLQPQLLDQSFAFRINKSSTLRLIKHKLDTAFTVRKDVLG